MRRGRPKGQIGWNKGLKGYNGQEKHYNWQGGITPLNVRLRHCFEYCKWRSDVFIRDNFTCQICGKKGGYLIADHFPKAFAQIIYEYKIKTFEQALVCIELWDIDNGRTLCRDCDRKHTKENYKRYKIKNLIGKNPILRKYKNMTDKKIQKKIVSVFIDPALHIKAKVVAARKKKSIGEIFEEALKYFFDK